MHYFWELASVWIFIILPLYERTKSWKIQNQILSHKKYIKTDLQQENPSGISFDDIVDLG